jgi:cyclohexyl-isocyanide hydratase
MKTSLCIAVSNCVMEGMLQIGFLAFDGVTQLDLTGPLQVLSRAPNSRVHVVALTQTVTTDVPGFLLHATCLTDECPQLDVLVVPGGFGVDSAISNERLLAFVRKQAEGARHVCSVCTGAFILGAAGLLAGKQSATHWAYRHLLPLVGATAVVERVVRDGKYVSGGGVTAGIDFALQLLGELAGGEYAASVQLSLEYDPAPPFPRIPADNVKQIADRRYEQRLATFETLLRALPPKQQ